MNLSRALLLSLALHLVPLLVLVLALLPAGLAGKGGQLPGTTGTPAPRLNMSLEQRPEPRPAAPSPRASHSVAARKEVPQAPAAPTTPKMDGGGAGNQTYYYSTAELSRRATLASQLDMSFVDKVTTPGQAIVILFIGPEGRVDEVRIEASTLSTEVENQLRQQFSDARFQPAERGGLAVRSRMQIEVFLGEPPAGTPAPPGPTSQSQ